MTLGEVIAAAIARHNALIIAGDSELSNRHEYIAAAVAAHLLSEEVLQRANAAALENMTKPMSVGRAAIRAAVGGEHG